MSGEAERKEEILWMRPDSVTYKISVGDGNYQVCKSYNPAQIEKAYTHLNPCHSSNIISGPNRLDTQSLLYRREVRLLRALQDLGTGLVPILCSENKENLEVYMEYLPYLTYQQKLLQAPNEEARRALVGELVDILQRVHSFCDENMDHILMKVNEGSKRILRERSIEEQTERIEKHLLLIAYTSGQYSQELREKVAQTLNSRVARTVIRNTLYKRSGMNLHSEAETLIRRDLELQKIVNSQKDSLSLRNSSPFVHGDFGPQNVFYTKVDDFKEENIKICDFDKTRLGSQNEDLVNSLYNIHMLPLTTKRVAFLEEQAEIYFANRKIKASELVTQRQALVSSTLGELIRFFGVYCKMDWQEITFFNGLNPSVPNVEESKQKYLQDYFVDSLHLYIDHHLSTNSLSLDRGGNILHKQLQSTKRILKTLGLVPRGGI